MINILDITFKDLTRSFRNAFAVGMAVVAPLLLVGLIYFAVGGASNGNTDLPAVKLGVVNADFLPAGAPLERPLGNDLRNMFFEASVESWITSHDYADEASARLALDRQEIGVVIIIPPDFSKRILDGNMDVHLRIIGDPTLMVAPQVVRNMVSAMLDGVIGGVIAVQTVNERYRALGLQPDPVQIQALIERYARWQADFQEDMLQHTDRAALMMIPPAGNKASTSSGQQVFRLMMAGQMAFFAFFTGAYSMTSLLREDEEGTLPRLFTTPVRRSSILAGKFLSVFLSLIVQGLVLIVAARYAFGISWGGPLTVALALSGQVFAAAGLGVLLISFVKTTRQAGPVLGGGLTLLGMLGGLFTVGLSMPETFTRLAVFTPQGWVIKAWNVALSGQPASELVFPVTVLAVMGLVMFLVGTMTFRKRFA